VQKKPVIKRKTGHLNGIYPWILMVISGDLTNQMGDLNGTYPWILMVNGDVNVIYPLVNSHRKSPFLVGKS